jgi:20S proteasome alpha/beta subunit
VREYELELELLIAGFDRNDMAQIFSLESRIDRGEPKRHDLGFYAIGSGSSNAEYILKFRELSPKTHVREALYYSVEAKFYGARFPSSRF